MESAPLTDPALAPAAARPLSGTQWTIAAAGQHAVITEIGGGLREYRADGVDYVDGYGTDELPPGCAGQILAPWPNRIRDGVYTFAGEEHQLALTEPERHNALHGLVNWLPWRLVSHAEDRLTIRADLPAQPGYPWPLRISAEWVVGRDGLTVRHEAVNDGDRPCPFGLAVHPYLRLPGVATDDLTLHLPARIRLLTDGRLLPIGGTTVTGTEYDFTVPRRIGDVVLDTAYGETEPGSDGLRTVTLAAADGSASVAVWADGAFRWWQVFTGDTLTGDRHRRSVAIEPMTCPPDAFRSGRDIIVLEPGRPWSGSWGIRPGH